MCHGTDGRSFRWHPCPFSYWLPCRVCNASGLASPCRGRPVGGTQTFQTLENLLCPESCRPGLATWTRAKRRPLLARRGRSELEVSTTLARPSFCTGVTATRGLRSNMPSPPEALRLSGLSEGRNVAHLSRSCLPEASTSDGAFLQCNRPAPLSVAPCQWGNQGTGPYPCPFCGPISTSNEVIRKLSSPPS